MQYSQFDDCDIRNQFEAFVVNLGISPAPGTVFLTDGLLHEFDIQGDRIGAGNGRYTLHADGLPSGWVKDWKRGIESTWSINRDNLSQEQRDFFDSEEFKQLQEQKRKERELQQKQLQDTASDNARIRIDMLPDIPENHPYLIKKHIFPYGSKQDGDNIALPLKDIDGRVRSLQWISPDGDKRFYPGAPVQGLFWSVALDTVKQDAEQTILIGEGFATMAKCYEITSLPSIAAMNCGNLLHVARAVLSRFPKANIIITADNDRETEINRGYNPGLREADKCVKYGCAKGLVHPVFPQNNYGTDWDDFAILYGDDYTRRYLLDRIHELLMPQNIKDITKRITLINAQDLRSKIFPPIKWAVPGFLPEGLSILAGGPKVGKSILALHLAVGVAIGGCVLGQFDVQQGNVLYFALEDTQRRLQDRINGGELAHEDFVDLSALDIITASPRQNDGGLDYIVYWMENHPAARLVIIDTLQMFRKLLSGKGSMYSEDYEAISAIKQIADAHHIALLIIHHLKKGMEGDWLSEISGSQGIAGAADTIFSLKRERNSNMATLHRTGRDVEEKDFIMKLDGFGWTLMGEGEGMPIPEWKSQILAFLKDNPSITPMQLAQAYGLPIKTAQGNLLRLMKEGTIKKTGHGKYEIPEE